MKQEHKLGLAAVVVLALGFAVYSSQKEQKAEKEAHSGTAASASLPTVKLDKEAIAKVDKLIVKNKDGEPITLEKKGDAWEITAPFKAKANDTKLKSVLDNLEKIEITASVGDKAELHEKYELTDGKAVHVQAFSGGSSVFDWYFGKNGTRGQMARAGGEGASPSVFTANGFAAFQWGGELKSWRFNEIAKFEDGNVIAAEVENKEGKLSFTKDGEDWKAAFYARNDEGELAKKAKEIERYDAKRVKDMLTAYKNLKAHDFAKDDAETGVDDVMANEGGIVRFTFKDESEPKYVFKVGKKQEGDNRFLVKEGDGQVYVVTSWAASWVTDGVSKFQKPEPKKPEGEAKGEDDAGADTKAAKAPAPKAPAPKAPAPKAAPK